MGMRRIATLFRQCLPLVLLTFASPAAAEIIIFTEGSFLEVESFRVEEERVHLELTPGGWVVMPLLRVERIVDDEVPTPQPEPLVAALPVAAPLFPLSFLPEQTVPASPYGDLIHATAQRYGLNPALIAAVARAESAFQPGAVSNKGARGLMQLMPATASRFGVDRYRVHDPAANIDAGSRYLRFLVDKFQGKLDLVLAAYNSGEGTVQRYGGVPPYRETREYIRRIYRTLGLDQPVVTS
jgi:hypothetical protein